MPDSTKIATCSYCGRRQTLRLSAREGHELACSACGAPLHEMKWLKPPKKEGKAKRSPRKAAPHGGALPQDREDWSGRKEWHGGRDDPRRRKKRRRKMWYRVAKEAFDVIEDIFD